MDYLDMVHMKKFFYSDPSGGEASQEAGISCQGKRVIIAPQDIMMDLMLRVMIFTQTISKDGQLKIRVVFLSLC